MGDKYTPYTKKGIGNIKESVFVTYVRGDIQTATQCSY